MQNTNRREFLKTSGKLTAVAAVLGSNMSVLMADSNPHKTKQNLKEAPYANLRQSKSFAGFCTRTWLYGYESRARTSTRYKAND